MPLPPWVFKISRKVISFFTMGEVKTPLSFYFRIATAILILGAAAIFLLLRSEPTLVYKLLLALMASLFCLAVIVGLLAWKSPRGLVYGESGYRAERRLTLGTEKREIAPTELEALPGTSNEQPSNLIEGGTE